MELIKQIKDAEKEAGAIVEQARQQAITIGDESRKSRAELLRQGQQARIRQIDEAIATAEKSGQIQVEKLLAKGTQEIDALKAASAKTVPILVDRVLSKLQQV